MKFIFALFLFSAFLLPVSAHAQCTSPPAEGGVIIFNVDHKVMQYCNGEKWVGLWGGGGPSSSGGTSLWTESGGNIYYNGGNVGIGTNSPAYKLDIEGGDVMARMVRVQSGHFVSHSPNAGSIVFNVGPHDASPGNSGIWFRANSVVGSYVAPYTSLMRITAQGNVGIGESNPTAKLHVVGTGLFTGNVAGSVFSGSGASLTNLNASNLASGTVPVARLGTGTANNTTYLRGDGTWAAEADPKVGATTNNRWCRGSGSQIICDQVAPPSGGGVFGGAYSRVSGGTCKSPNPFTSACSCPSGFNDQLLANGLSGSEQYLNICWKS